MQRLQDIHSQLTANKVAAHTKSAEDVVICAAVRTPLTKAKRGLLKDTAPEYLLSVVLKEVAIRAKIDPKNVEDIVVGNVLQPGAGSVTARMGQYLAGYPDTTTIVGVNRQCSSGIEACAIIAGKIRAKQIDIGIGAGVESMSLYDMQSSLNPENLSELIFENEKARNCMVPMGETSENVAEKFGISREKQDRFAAESHAKAHKAQKEGLFKSEIVPVKTTVKDKDGKAKEVLVTEDDGVRAETTAESLSKLKPAFKKTGTTTAGNASQVTDGAAAVLLARRSVAEKLGLPIIARFVDYTVAGVPPEIMGVGPAYAIPRLLEKNGLNKD
jgi:acetyl-CoA acyltransferase 1